MQKLQAGYNVAENKTNSHFLVAQKRCKKLKIFENIEVPSTTTFVRYLVLLHTF